MPVVHIQEFDKYQEVKGVFVEGCVERGDGSRFRAYAHSHINKQDSNKGWICVLSRKRLRTESGSLGTTMIHELAHILSGHGHDDIWRKKMRELGGTIRKHYTKQYFQQRRK